LPCPNESEREGYVPNVVHTCGALLHGHELIVPYTMGDSAARFATVSLADDDRQDAVELVGAK
jgi:predicted GH43/DUF377 family glycosyl hydrolase